MSDQSGGELVPYNSALIEAVPPNNRENLSAGVIKAAEHIGQVAVLRASIEGTSDLTRAQAIMSAVDGAKNYATVIAAYNKGAEIETEEVRDKFYFTYASTLLGQLESFRREDSYYYRYQDDHEHLKNRKSADNYFKVHGAIEALSSVTGDRVRALEELNQIRINIELGSIGKGWSTYLLSGHHTQDSYHAAAAAEIVIMRELPFLENYFAAAVSMAINSHGNADNEYRRQAATYAIEHADEVAPLVALGQLAKINIISHGQVNYDLIAKIRELLPAGSEAVRPLKEDKDAKRQVLGSCDEKLAAYDRKKGKIRRSQRNAYEADATAQHSALEASLQADETYKVNLRIVTSAVDKVLASTSIDLLYYTVDPEGREVITGLLSELPDEQRTKYTQQLASGFAQRYADYAEDKGAYNKNIKIDNNEVELLTQENLLDAYEFLHRQLGIDIELASVATSQ